VAVECGHPDEFLYKFQGRFVDGDKVEALNPDQLLLRVLFSPVGNSSGHFSIFFF